MNQALNQFVMNSQRRTATLALKEENRDAFPWDAPVHVERLFSESGIISGRFAVIAVPSIESGFSPREVGGYVKGDALLSNVDAVQATEDALNKCGFEFTREIRLVRGGGGIEITYTVHNYPIQVGHSMGKPQIKLRNSYDGAWKFSASFWLLMLVCLNGLFTLKSVECLNQKHSAKLNVGFMAEKLLSLVEHGVASARSFEKLMDYPIADDAIAANVFGNVSRISKGAVSKRNAAEMLTYFLNPDDAEKQLDYSLWRAYMAGTRMVRDLSTVRPTVASEVNAWLGQIFGLVADKGNGHFGNPSYLTRTPDKDFDLLEVDIQVI